MGKEIKKQNLLSCLSKKENKIRSSFKNYLIFESVFYIICSMYGYWNNTAAQLLCILFALTGIYMLYHCAYKKHGTAFLSLQMIIGVPWSIIRTYSDCKEDLKETPVLIGFLLLISLSLAFYYFSIRLRRVNKKIQQYAFISSDHYRKAVDSMNTAKTIDELSFRFHEAFRECPSHFSHLLSPLYEDIKKRLLQTESISENPTS